MSGKAPKVSILMNCYNGEQYLKEAIDSIYAQTFSDWEIIFVDNCSGDRSAEIANSYGEKLHYVKTEKNIPLYAARNIGLQYVNGEFLAFLDVDDFWAPEKLTKQLTIFDQHENCALVHSAYLLRVEDVQREYSLIKAEEGWTSFDSQLYSYIVNIQSTMLRLSRLPNSLKRFDGSLNLLGDYELFMKVIHDFPSYFIAEPLVTTREHQSNLSQKLHSEFPVELGRVVQTLQPMLKPYQIKLMDLNMAKAQFKLLAQQHSWSKGRKLIAPYLFKDKRLLIFYLISFLPMANSILCWGQRLSRL